MPNRAYSPEYRTLEVTLSDQDRYTIANGAAKVRTDDLSSGNHDGLAVKERL